MCTAATQTLLEGIIEEKVLAGEMFTAFDVSMESKARGETERHRSIKHVVHDYYEGGRFPTDYTRTLLNVGAPEQAFVYHRTVDDPTTYKSKYTGGKVQSPQKQQTVKAATPPAPVNVISVVTPAQNDGGAALPGGAVARADARGTVLIPADVVRKAGFQPKANVSVYGDPASKSVVVVADKSQVPAGMIAQAYTVDGANNIRVTAFAFSKAGVNPGSKGTRFKAEYQKNQITITTA